MKRLTTSRSLLLAAIIMAATFSACDFQAAEDAFDDFDVIIGLDPINTVVNGVFQDAGTGEPISARITFGGPDAAVLIDAYSDPVVDITAGSGMITFGIRNSVTPSSANPVMFDVTATADGYFSNTRRVILDEEGDGFFTMNLSRSDVNASIQGTSGTRNSSVSSNSTGQVQQTQTVQTQAPSQQTQAQVTMTIPAGTTPRTANGTPLVGQLTTELRAYDSGSGLAALPNAARLSSTGSSNAIVGATFFKMSDQNGNVAVSFSSSTGKTSAFSAGKSSVCLAGDTSIELTSTDSALISALIASGGSSTADVFAYQPANGLNPNVGTVLVSYNAALNRAESEICLGSVSPNVSLSAVTDPSGGLIFTFALSGGNTTDDFLEATVAIDNGGVATNVDFTLVGGGVLYSGNKLIDAGNKSYTLKNLVGNPGSVTTVNGTEFVLTADVSGTVVTSTGSDPHSGSFSMTLPSTTGLAVFNATASVVCPAGQEFDVKLTSESLDAVTVFYKRSSSSSWSILPNSSVTRKEAFDNKVEVDGTLSLLPNTGYFFRGVLGTDAASTGPHTTPGATGPWNIPALDADDIGLECN